jgi:hypothetical protein
MKVATRAGEGDPRLTLDGAHALSWAFLLDYIFADTYHRGVGELQFVVGHPGLMEAIEQRAEVTPDPSAAGPAGAPKALAALAAPASRGQEASADVLYTVEYGPLAPPSLRRNNPQQPGGWALDKQLAVFTWKARALGILLRVAAALHRPRALDSIMQRVNRVFVSEQSIPAFYYLKIWQRDEAGREGYPWRYLR